MANREVSEIIESIMEHEYYRDISDIKDQGEFCEQVGHWVNRLDAIANDDEIPTRGSKAIIVESMEMDGISLLVQDGLHEDIDKDQISSYFDSYNELREMVKNMHETYPKSFPLPIQFESVGYRT